MANQINNIALSSAVAAVMIMISAQHTIATKHRLEKPANTRFDRVFSFTLQGARARAAYSQSRSTANL